MQDNMLASSLFLRRSRPPPSNPRLLTVLLLQRRRETVHDAPQDLQQLPDPVVSRALVHKPGVFGDGGAAIAIDGGGNKGVCFILRVMREKVANRKTKIGKTSSDLIG